MTIQEGLGIKSVLMKFVNSEMSFKTGYKVMRNLKRLDEDSHFYQEQLKSLMEKYAEPNSVTTDGKFKIKTGLEDEANKQFNELLSCPIEPLPCTFSSSELDSLTLTPVEIGLLMPLIAE